MRRRIVAILIIFFVSTLPCFAHAAVRINEVAWMGSTDNANAEWIELFNSDDAPVSLAGWILTASSGSPSISLTGSIAGKGWYLLERTSDDTVPTVPAGKIYTGALTNSGTTLTLKDSTGTTVDEVIGGTNWSTIGGDNASKQTPQRSEDGSTWTTATATPGAKNTIATEDTNEAVPSSTSTKAVPVFPHIYIDGLLNKTVSTFDFFNPEVLIYDDQTHRVQYASIHWAFGDGARENGYHPRHAYEYSGEYIVGVIAESNNLKTEGSFVVTVDDANIQIVENSIRGIGLYNGNNRVVVLSNWIVKLGDASYQLPEGTQILPGKTIILPRTITKLTVPSGDVSLRYPSGKIATTFLQTFAVKSL